MWNILQNRVTYKIVVVMSSIMKLNGHEPWWGLYPALYLVTLYVTAVLVRQMVMCQRNELHDAIKHE